MERTADELTRTRIPGLALALLLMAFIAFTAANIIHNRYGLDPALIPGALFTLLCYWKRRGWMLYAAAAFIAIPSFIFFKGTALTSSADTLYLANHVFLLLAGLFGLAAAVQAVLAARREA